LTTSNSCVKLSLALQGQKVKRTLKSEYSAYFLEYEKPISQG